MASPLRMPQYTKAGFEKGRLLLNYLTELGKEKNCRSGQLSLAWILCREPWIVPIPGSRKEDRLQENFGAVDVLLTVEEISKIDSLLDGMDLPAYGMRTAEKVDFKCTCR